MQTRSFWMEVPIIKGSRANPPSEAGIAIIGAGLSGVSAAYWLQKYGWSDILIIDDEPEVAASFRNCGHILRGTVESMAALTAIHGRETAKEVWGYSVEICNDIRETILREKMKVDYEDSGYICLAIDDTEKAEIENSIRLLNEAGFQSEYLGPHALEALGFLHAKGARYEKSSARAHPVKFRNALLEIVLKNGAKYFSGVRVKELNESGASIRVETADFSIKAEAVIVAANAYSPLLSSYYLERRLVEPFRGQIITSRPFASKFHAVREAHSFDHGYQYAIFVENRLMIGGWRHHTATKEVGTYDLSPNPEVSLGLKEFVKHHYNLDLEWEYEWTGIMAASKTGFPFIGPTAHPRIFTVAGYTGHGFSWAHGSAKLLAEIIMGHPIPAVARFFRPPV